MPRIVASMPPRMTSSTFSTPAVPLAARPHRYAADEDCVGTEAQGLHDVGTTADTTVHHDLDVVADRCGDLGQHPDRGGGGVDIVSAVVGNRDGGDAGVDGPPGFVARTTPLTMNSPSHCERSQATSSQVGGGVIIQAP